MVQDNPAIMKHICGGTTGVTGTERAKDSYCAYVLSNYRRRLGDWSMIELKQEVGNMKRKLGFCEIEGKDRAKLKVSGRRQDIIDALSRCAWLYINDFEDSRGGDSSSSKQGEEKEKMEEEGFISLEESDSDSSCVDMDSNGSDREPKARDFGRGELVAAITKSKEIPLHAKYNDDKSMEGCCDLIDSDQSGAVELSCSDSECSDDWNADDDFDNEREGDDQSRSDSKNFCKVQRPLAKSTLADFTSESTITFYLQRTFGHSALRPEQLWAVRRVLQGERSLLVLPTGSGKSMCFLLPTLLAARHHGLTIVVSPLVALMRDQMRRMPLELPAACLSGGLSAGEIAEIASSILSGYTRLLYVSPERLCSPSFRSLVSRIQSSSSVGIGLLCVDEAHCLSQWSFNFRPSFLRVKRELVRMKPRAVLALTATAPPDVRDDIREHLEIPSEGVLACPPMRSNLSLHAMHIGDETDRREKVFESIARRKYGERAATQPNDVVSNGKRVGPAVVYVGQRFEAESLSEYLHSRGVSCRAYHAGLDSAERTKIELTFYKGSVDVVVATIAFGLGIDKSDIRLVVHASLPKSVENYLQASESFSFVEL